MVDIIQIGSGGVLPTQNRKPSSAFIRYFGNGILIDCGEGTQANLRQANISVNAIDVILLTHTHGDHIFGLPGLLSTMELETRKKPLLILGPRTTHEVLTAAFAAMISVKFAVNIFDISEQSIQENPTILVRDLLSVQAFSLKHRVPCLGFRIVIKRLPKFCAEKAEKLGIPSECWRELRAKGFITVEGNKFYDTDVTGCERPGVVIGYVTDTLLCDNVYKVAQDSDLFICEAMCPDSEQSATKKPVGHLTLEQSLSVALASNAKALWSTHISPKYALSASRVYQQIAKQYPIDYKVGFDLLHTTLFYPKDYTIDK